MKRIKDFALRFSSQNQTAGVSSPCLVLFLSCFVLFLFCFVLFLSKLGTINCT